VSRASRLAYRAAKRTADPDRLVWERDGHDWPNRSASRFIRAAGLNWHVQEMGHGPVVLLVHGTGASTHSWVALMPLLARRFTVVAIDLPGHGFTDLPDSAGLSLPGMAGALSELIAVLGIYPEVAVGHSAGAAILARMCLDGQIAPTALITLNGAFLPLHGLPVKLLTPVTRLLVSIPSVARLVAHRAADESAVRRLLDGTGSKLEPKGIELYRRLFSTPAHVAGALGMMTNWRLDTLEQELARLTPALVLVAADNDRTISPRDAARVRSRVPTARIVSLPGLGHLAHEEAPEIVADIIDQAVVAPRKRARS
jgi:magnesium chelatase accessory protein